MVTNSSGVKGEVKLLNLQTPIGFDDDASTDVVTGSGSLTSGSSCVFYVPTNNWVHLEATIQPAADKTRALQIQIIGGEVTNGAMGYIDNITIAEYVAPTEFDVTITAGENANVSVKDAVVQGT